MEPEIQLEMDGDIPLFKQLRNVIINQINNSVYHPGDLIPSEVELMEKYSVSRTTVRSAIDALVRQGYVYKIHGKGTYLADPQVTQNLNNLTSFSQIFSHLGKEPKGQLLRLETGLPDKHLAAKLHISPTSEVIYLDRLLCADKMPVSYSKTCIAIDIIRPYKDQITAAAIKEHGLYKLLLQLGIKLTGGEHLVSAVSATKELAEMLEIEFADPLLFGELTSYTQSNIPVEYSSIWTRADITRWRIILGPFKLDS